MPVNQLYRAVQSATRKRAKVKHSFIQQINLREQNKVDTGNDERVLVLGEHKL